MGFLSINGDRSASSKSRMVASGAFTPRSISGLALWLDASDTTSTYTTDAGPVTAVSSPLDISGCVGWWDASDAASITESGGLVSQLNDKSGLAAHASQGTSGARPTLVSNALNGRSLLRFDGGDGLTGNFASSIGTNAYSVFAVCKATSVVTNGRVFSVSGAGNDFASGMMIPCCTNATSVSQLSAYDGASGANKGAVDGFTSYAVFSGVVGTSSLSNAANGVRAASASVTLTTAVTRFGIGAPAQGLGSGAGWNGDIAEVIYYSAALTTAQRASVEAYLAQRWGISGVHAPATASSDPVGYWRDKSGNNRHATQATAGNRPTVGSMGSRRALRLGASAAVSRLSLGNLSAAFPSAGNVFVAFQPNNDLQYTLYSTRNNDDTYANTSTSLWGTWVNTRTSVTSSRPSSGAHVANLYGTTGAFSVIEDGALIHSSSALTWEPGNDHNIGSRSASAAGQTPLDGWIGEVIAYNRALTTSERQRLEFYLATRWGITLAPTVSNADAQDWINRVYANGGTVSASTASAVNTFCDSIDAAGIRDRFYRLNIFAGSLGASIQASGCVVPLYRGPSLSGTQYGNATDMQNSFSTTDYSDTTGLTATTSSAKYLDTGLTTAALPASVYESMHLSAWHGPLSATPTDPTMLGVFSSTDRHSIQTSIRTTAIAYETGRSGRTQTVVATNGVQGARPSTFLLTQRQSATSLQLFRNGTLEATNTTSVTGIASSAFPMFVFGYNNSGTRVGDQPGTPLRHYSIGDDMTGSQVLAFYNALAAFNTAMGRTA